MLSGVSGIGGGYCFGEMLIEEFARCYDCLHASQPFLYFQ